MATTKRKPETAAEKARRLRFFVDGGTPLPPKDAAWLKAYEPAEVKRQARKTKAGDARLKQAETKAKKTGRSLTVADLREAAKPAQPVSFSAAAIDAGITSQAVLAESMYGGFE